MRDALMRLRLSGHGALVAIAEWIGDRLAGLIQAHIVHGPSVDGDRAHTFMRDLSTPSQALLQPGQDELHIPAQRAFALHRVVRKAMNELRMRRSALPAKQRHTTALRPQVDGDE